MSIALASPTSTLPTQLDDLLDAIGIKLQISQTAYDEAVDRYHTIAELLNEDGNPLAKYSPDIYPQGSLRIGTTLKPKGEDEYDLDLVCLLNADLSDFPNPITLLDLVESTIRANKTYDGMVERKNRCVRITYAGKFHMDILPACPVPTISEAHGQHCLKVPDCNLKDWKDSNPKGFALWFEEKMITSVATFRKSIEALPERQTYQEKETLKRVVQLMKRYRDVELESLEVKERPISIVLTTLAARHHTGTSSVIEALTSILMGIKAEIESSRRLGEKRIMVLNPTNKNEDLSERWDSDPKLYPIFVNWIDSFIVSLSNLRLKDGLPAISKQLEVTFGEKPAKAVIEDYVKRVSSLRGTGNLATTGSGLIVTKETAKSTIIQPNTFHGEL